MKLADSLYRRQATPVLDCIAVMQMAGGPCSPENCSWSSSQGLIELATSTVTSFHLWPIQLLSLCLCGCLFLSSTMSSLRTLAPFLRTARTSARSSNPLISLQRQSALPVLNLRRGYAVFERSKPHVNIGKSPRSHTCYCSEAHRSMNRHNWSRRSRQGTSRPL